MILADKNACTGCGACASICPCEAISMITDKEGFFYPLIAAEKCIGCGSCKNVCPAFKEHKNTFDKSTFFAAWTKCAENRKAASSGGLFGEIAQWVIKNDGVVFGTAFSDDYKSLSCQSTDNVSLAKLKKSKYFESNMDISIKKIKVELDKDRWVFFCGTPCQAIGVRASFGYKYDKLIIADFLCHGVPSQKAYQKYINDIELKYKSKVSEVSFRSKKFGWKTYCMLITFENGKKYLRLGITDPFYKLFLRNYSLRDSCYGCDRVEKSEADITLGDFWGVTKLKRIVDTDEGISLVMLHNKKGIQIFNKTKNRLNTFELTRDDVAYAVRPKKNHNKREINFDEFNFFHNSVLPKNNFTTYCKSICLKNKHLRKLIRIIRGYLI